MNDATGLDTNILARYYVNDESDAASLQQRQAARKLIESGRPLAVSKTVILELEWVLRGYYHFAAADISKVFSHMLAQAHIHVEDRRCVEQAISNHAAGLDFADALHHSSYAKCKAMASFDDRRFARRARKLSLVPVIQIPR